MAKSKSGKVALLFNVKKGAKIIGDGSVTIPANTWNYIDAQAAQSSELPLKRGYYFKNGASEITPVAGDVAIPLMFEKICKVDCSVSTEKGTIDVTDDCESGYNAMIVDGFTNISGSANGFLKFEDDGALTSQQREYWGRFFDIVDDDGAGRYTLDQKNDNDTIIAILQNSDQVLNNGAAVAENKQVWLMVPAIITGITTDKPLKGVQNFDFTWEKSQGPASIYVRTTNSTEAIF